MNIIKSNKVFNTHQTLDILVNVFNVSSIKKCVYLAVIMFIITTCFILNMLIMEHQDMVQNHFHKFPTDMKYILFWKKEKNIESGFYLMDNLLPGQTMFIKQNCKMVNCFITYDQNLLNGNTKNFDAVVFNINDIYNVKHINLKLARSPQQLYIFNSMDSAELFPICLPAYGNFFNLTWTYRLDSDIPNPFFNIYDSNNTMVGPKRKMNWKTYMKHTNKYRNKIHNKTKAVAWIINKCRSKRKHYQLVTDLRQELNSYNYSLDIYGNCGGLKCPNKNILNCYNIIEKDYYFLLVLEDSTAIDHISERMALTMMHFVVPIIQGRSEYSGFLPPGSYINIKNSAIKELGTIIDYLIKNPQLYEYFFDWKNYYYYTIRPQDYVCDLCMYLNQNNLINKRMISNLREWWNTFYQINCNQKRMYDLFIANE